MKIQITFEIKQSPKPKKKSPAKPKQTLSQSLKNTVIINHK
jgi:hypothetical protein